MIWLYPLENKYTRLRPAQICLSILSLYSFPINGLSHENTQSRSHMLSVAVILLLGGKDFFSAVKPSLLPGLLFVETAPN